jgi:hypothetical protein
MAAAEAAAWGYLGFILTDGPLRLLTAAFTGVIILLVVWMVDVSLITMDRAWPEHARSILGQQPKASARGLRDTLTFLVRILLLLGSLTITAPYLAQLVFYRDIQQVNDALAAERIDAARSRLTERYDEAIRAKQRTITESRSEYESEIAGRGPSGRFGAGPTAAAIQRNITALEAERDVLTQERARELGRFEALSRNPETNREQLAARYKVLLPEQTVLGNSAALIQLRRRPEYRQTELAIKAFLGFIFAGLLLLKLFEPHSVRLYFSEVLQQEFSRYLASVFDDVLPPAERSTATGGAMAPQRFYSFLTNVWSPARLLEEKQAEGKARVAAAVQAIETVERMRDAAIRDVNRRKEEVARLTKAREAAVLSSTQLDSAIRAVDADVKNLEHKLHEVLERPDRLDELSWLEHRTSLARNLTEARRALRELEESVPAESYRKEHTEADLTNALHGLQDSAKELETIEKQLRELRELLANSTSARARSVLKAV